MSTAVNALKKLWRGLQPLPRAFWGYYVAGCILFFLCVAAIGGLLNLYLPVARPMAYTIGPFIIWAYWITASVGVWRSAGAAGAGKLPIAAKIVVVLLAVIFAFRMLNGGASQFVAVIVEASRNLGVRN
jgi:hypothetical protein